MSHWGKRNKTLLFITVAVLIIGVVMNMPIPFGPPGDTRMILDHTKKVYAAPPCFEQADLTNYLRDSTWSKARSSGYEPESACTSQYMEPVDSSIWKRIMVAAGLRPSPWSW